MTYKKIIIAILFFTFCGLPSFAEKIPVKIAPTQMISTHHDEIEIGDCLNFEVAKDVYLNDNLYIKKGATIKGIVDFVHPNGWGGDSADIIFKKFYTTDVNNKKVEIDYPLDINGKAEMANNTRSISSYAATNKAPLIILHYVRQAPLLFYQTLNYTGFVIRGAEICVEPDTTIYNIFIERESTEYSPSSKDL